jgi:hypothetical protein
MGDAFTYQIAASNNATSYTASGLPAGLTLNATSGLISGTPTAVGNSTIILGATNAGGTGSANLALQVLPPPPAITSALSANATMGDAFTYQITASNNATSYSASGLPAGLTLNATSGLISGTPTAEGAFTVGLMAANSGGSSSVTNLALTIVHTRIISVSGNLSFGALGINQTATRTLTISNTGTGNLTVTGLTYPTGFSGNLSGNLTVAPNTSQNVTVTFTPTAPGSYTGNLVVLSNASLGNASIATSGTGVAISLPGSFSGLRLWLKADEGVSKDAADKVSGWADQSSSGNPASQASAAKQPLWISSALNGQPVLRFDGDDFLTLGSSPSLATGNFTFFVVASTSEPWGTQALLSRDVGSGWNNKWIYWINYSRMQMLVQNPSTYQYLESRDFSRVANKAEIFFLSKAGRDYQHFLSGTMIGAQTANLDVPSINSDFRIGQAEDNFYLRGDMAEVVIYDRVLSIEERQAVENYLALKYALPITQDTDGDGMPDGWEVANGLNPLADDTLEDLDGDRVPNIFEFQRGTLANDAASKPAATFVVNPATGGASTTDNVYATIQEAVNKAQGIYNWETEQYEMPNAYAVIEVKAGSYAEEVTLSEVPVVLLGELGAQAGPAAILGRRDADNDTLEVFSASVVDGFYIGKLPGRKGCGVYVRSNSRLVNCVIRGNEYANGAGVYSIDGARLDLVHCTVFGNKGDSQGRGIHSTGTLNLINSIVWGNTGAAGQEIYKASGTINATTSIVAGGEHGGLNLDPQLTPVGWLKSTSPAMNRAGTAVVSRVDIHGEARPSGATPDLGADEYKDANGTGDGDGLPDWAEGAEDQDGLSALEEYTTHGTNPWIADIDGDGLNDGAEVARGTSASNPDTDLDGMPDGWEVANGLNPLVDDTLEDQDGDRVPSIFEFQRGTLANDAASKPAASFVVNPATGGNSTTDNVYATIQEAVNKAQEWGYNNQTSQWERPNAYAVIEVKAGSYAEKVTLNVVPVVLLGELGTQAGPPAILGRRDWDDNSLEIYSASVVDGFAIGKVPGRKGRGVYVRSNSRLVNCLIRGNEVDRGAAAYNEGARLDMVHCTIFGNKGTSQGRGIYNTGILNLINSIVWGNTGAAGQEIYKASGTINASSSIVAGGEHGGLNLDPQLTPAGWLKSTSPAINRAGTAVVSRVDIHGEARPSGATPDLGADEYKDANGTGDGDGLPDWAEGAEDNDGLSALEEYSPHGTNPWIADIDGDGLNDGAEVARGTSPISSDTDLDTMPDGWEVANGLNPLVDDTLEDQDGDRVPNIFEFQRGTLANDAASKPVATFVVNPATGGTSATDNVYATIQEAVNKAREQVWNSAKGQYERPNAYAVIEVKAGSYAEKVTLNDVPVVLLGELGAQAGPPAILGRRDWDDTSLDIYSASVLDGFEIGKVPGRKGRGVYVRSNSRLVNCLIRGNEVDRGAAAYIDGFRLDMVHCTVFGNKGTYEGRGIYNTGILNLLNSIVWGNTGAAGQEIYKATWGTPQINASSSIVAGGEHGGLNLDPQLTPAGWLKSTSPAMNRAGTAVVSRVDIHGEARPSGATPDLGADEYKDANGTADGDGLPDWAEGAEENDGLSALEEYTTYGTNPWIADTDNDGLNDGVEAARGTSPISSDTDLDTMPDGWEVANGFEPKAASDGSLDTDADGYTNAEEYQFGKNPRFKEDTDGDGMPDGWEYHNGLNLEVNDTALDPDQDGLANLLEYQIGTKANVFDTDGDGLPDGFEYRYRSRLRPTVWDDKNLDPDGDGITDKWEAFYGFDPTVADGGADPDGDGLSSAEEIAGGSSPVDADIDADGLNDKQEREQGTSPWRGDTDYDSLRDGWEVANGFNPKQWNDPASDGDNDGLSDWWEARQATNPRVADTDGDGTNDGTEVANKTDPTDPEWGGSPPAAPSEIRETVNADGSITYTWKDNSNNEEGFRIRQKQADGTWMVVGSTPANTTTHTVPAR